MLTTYRTIFYGDFYRLTTLVHFVVVVVVVFVVVVVVVYYSRTQSRQSENGADKLDKLSKRG